MNPPAPTGKVVAVLLPTSVEEIEFLGPQVKIAMKKLGIAELSTVAIPSSANQQELQDTLGMMLHSALDSGSTIWIPHHASSLSHESQRLRNFLVMSTAFFGIPLISGLTAPDIDCPVQADTSCGVGTAHLSDLGESLRELVISQSIAPLLRDCMDMLSSPFTTGESDLKCDLEIRYLRQQGLSEHSIARFVNAISISLGGRTIEPCDVPLALKLPDPFDGCEEGCE